MAKNKTNETESSVKEFVNNVENEIRRDDSFKLIEMITALSGLEPKMWGPTIIGFGSYHYKYESGHEGEAPLVGFSPRKDSLVLYFGTSPEHREELLSKLGKHKSGKSCVYVKKLDDVDQEVLSRLVISSITDLQNLYPNK